MAQWSPLPDARRATKCGSRNKNNDLLFTYFNLCCLAFNNLYLMRVADKRATEPNFSLVNREGLDKILKAKVFVNEHDSQLRAAHSILRITPISHAFQAPKCMIKAHDPRLHLISVAMEGFLLLEGAPIPEGTFPTQPILFPGPTTEGTLSSTSIPKGIPRVGASLSQQFTGIATPSSTRSSEEEKVVKVTNSEDEFEVFNKDLSPETSVTDLGPHFSPIIDEMGIQRKPKSSLLELIKNQLERDALGKTVHSKSPTPPHALPPP